MPNQNYKSRRPKLLLLSQVLPYPPDTGVSVRTYNTLRLLADRFDITLLAFSRAAAHPTVEERGSASKALSDLADTTAFRIPQEHNRLRFMWDHSRSLITRAPYTRYVYDSSGFKAAVREAIAREEWDVVQLESLDLYAYLDEFPDLPVVVVHHNVESQLLERRARVLKNPVSAWYLRYQARLIEREEKQWCEDVALNVAVSRADAEALSKLAPEGSYVVVPNGVDTEFFAPSKQHHSERNGVVFLGGTEWLPNKDGLDYFCSEILGPLRAEIPEIPVHWVGRSTPDEQRRYMERYGVTLTGYVDDVRPYIANAHCSVVPLRFGGGTRLKITTAWAMGSAIVTTTLGCEGLSARDGENLLIRDDPLRFADAIVEIVRNEALRERLEDAARSTAVTEYSWDVIGRRMLPAYEALLSPSSTGQISSQR